MARQRGKRWMADVKDSKGNRVRPTFPSKTEAETWEYEAKAAVLRGEPLPPIERASVSVPVPKLSKATHKAGMTISDLAQETYDLHWQRNRSAEDSWINAQDVVKTIGESRAVVSLDYDAILDLRQKLLDRGLQPATVNRKLAALSKMLTHAYRKGIIPGRPKIERLKEANERIRWIEADEEQQMLAWCDEHGKADFKDFIILLMDTGLRCGEALALKWEDTKLDTGKIHVWRNKADHPRTVPMTKRVREMLQQRRDGVAGYAESLFAGMKHTAITWAWGQMKKAMGREEDGGFVPHCLRHTFCTRLVQRGVNIAKVQRLAGHKTIKMTLRYAHIADKDLDEAISVLD